MHQNILDHMVARAPSELRWAGFIHLYVPSPVHHMVARACASGSPAPPVRYIVGPSASSDAIINLMVMAWHGHGARSGDVRMSGDPSGAVVSYLFCSVPERANKVGWALLSDSLSLSALGW